MGDEYEIVYPSGNQNHFCDKEDCFYCYEMNRPDKVDIPLRKNGWSERQLQLLTENYGTINTSDIAQVIKKSKRAIHQKVHELRKLKTEQISY